MPSRLVRSRSKQRIRPDLLIDPQSAYAVLEQQVVGLEKDVTDLSASIIGLDRKLTESITSLASRMETAIGGVTAKLDERSRTHWPTLIAAGSLLVVIMGSLGTLAYMPIKAVQDTQGMRIDLLDRADATHREQMGWLRARMGEPMPR